MGGGGGGGGLGGEGVSYRPTPEKTTLKKASLIRVTVLRINIPKMFPIIISTRLVLTRLLFFKKIETTLSGKQTKVLLKLLN